MALKNGDWALILLGVGGAILLSAFAGQSKPKPLAQFQTSTGKCGSCGAK